MRRILNAEITGSTASWKSKAMEPDDVFRWAAGHSILRVGVNAQVDGFAAASRFRSGDGYNLTLEHSVYVDAATRGQGLGRRLLSDLIERARSLGYHRLVGAISADQPASLALHRRMEFTECGRLPQVGRKFGRWLDLVLMIRAL